MFDFPRCSIYQAALQCEIKFRKKEIIKLMESEHAEHYESRPANEPQGSSSLYRSKKSQYAFCLGLHETSRFKTNQGWTLSTLSQIKSG